MIITYHGGQCFKVQKGDTVIAFNPIAKKSKQFVPTKFGADVVFSTMNHVDFNGVDMMSHGQKKPFLIQGPGEYEVGEITAQGYGVPVQYDKKDFYNTLYQVTFDGINILFLGALGTEELDRSILGSLSAVDILFVPIADGDIIGPVQASKLAVKLEAKVIIPMHYDKKTLETFIKEEGGGAVTPQDKLTIKAKDVAAMEGEIVVLKS